LLKDRAPKPKPGGIAKARKLRKAMSLPEVLLWQLLRGQPRGVKFRRQHPSSEIRMDFYCSDARLVVEVDGISHDMGDRPQRDLGRNAWLKSKGLDAMRFPASDVLRDASATADAIIAFALSRLPAHHPAVLAAQTQYSPPSGLRPATSPRQARGGSKEAS
jgi:very-short-patch-repair endonuclease